MPIAYYFCSKLLLISNIKQKIWSKYNFASRLLFAPNFNFLSPYVSDICSMDMQNVIAFSPLKHYLFLIKHHSLYCYRQSYRFTKNKIQCYILSFKRHFLLLIVYSNIQLLLCIIWKA